MAISLSETVRTTRDLEANLGEVLGQVRRSKNPVLITKAGKPDLIIMNVETYEYRLHVANLSHLLAEGMEDIRTGRTQPVEEFLKEFKGAQKIRSRNRRKGQK